MLGSQKRYFFVFCLILTLFLAVLSLGAWGSYSELSEEETFTSRLAEARAAARAP